MSFEIEENQSHFTEKTFLRVAEPILKVSNLAESKIFEALREACADK